MSLDALANELDPIIQTNSEHIAYHVCSLTNPDQQIGHQAHISFQIASAFKAFVAGAVCQAMDNHTLDFVDQLPITAEDRLPDSIGTQDYPDGHLLTVKEALNLMIGVSDNTATEMLMRRIDTQAFVDQLSVDQSQLKSVSLPPLLSDFINRALSGDETWAQVSPQASMSDLVSFYRAIDKPEFFASADVYRQYWEVLHEEDRIQSTNWGDGVLCYRKSGSLELNGFYVLSIAGIIKNAHTGFAFALVINQQAEDEQHAIDLQQSFGQLASGLLRGLSAQLKA